MKRAIGLILTLMLLVVELLVAGAAWWTSAELDATLARAQQLIDETEQQAQQLADAQAEQAEVLEQLQAEGQTLAEQLAGVNAQIRRYEDLQQLTDARGELLGENFTQYRNMLSATGQELYDRMRVNFRQEQYTVSVPPQSVISFDSVFDIYIGVLMDDPGMFQLEKSLRATYSDSGNTITPDVSFTGAALDDARARFDAEAAAVLQNAAARPAAGPTTTSC